MPIVKYLNDFTDIIHVSQEHDDEYWPHRDTNFTEYIYFDTPVFINALVYMIAKLMSDNRWWIISRSSLYDDVFEDIGPFETLEAAMLHARLIQDVA